MREHQRDGGDGRVGEAGVDERDVWRPDGTAFGGPRDAAVPPRLWTIAGNVIGNQANNVHLTACEAVTLSGNTIYLNLTTLKS
jgi:hypothetical protein